VTPCIFLDASVSTPPGLAPANVDEELRLPFDGFEAVLAQANMTRDHLVGVQIFSDLSLWDRSISKDLPARAFIGSGPLLKGGRFEMMGIAVRTS
jgi:2-iminobutanoate/2-iminopropanoate deaminase